MPSINEKDESKKANIEPEAKKTPQSKTRNTTGTRKTPRTTKKAPVNNSPKAEEETTTRPMQPKRRASTKEAGSYFTKGQSFFGYMLTIMTSVVVAVMLTLLLMPLALKQNPIDFYRGDFFESANSKTIINTKSAGSIVAAVAKKVKPSVVTISAISQSNSSSYFPGLGQEEKATGTGVIFRSNGYILTNNHVIEGASKVFVTFGKSTDIPGTIISGDSESDIAVIKIDKNNLPAADIGSTKNLEVGDLAVAIGSPFRFHHTVTAGIISAKNRAFGITDYESSSSKTLTDLLQTDAAINPGNSGGALANAKGEIIGINTAIASDSRSSAGIGFAIPIEKAMSVAKQLSSKQKVSHPYIGVDIVETEKVSLPNLPKGVFIQQVMSGSPAQKAGLKDGDVVTKANDTRVKTAEDLITMIKRGTVGKNLRITFIRAGKTKTVEVTLAEKPSLLQP